jgi:hypothetical protein
LPPDINASLNRYVWFDQLFEDVTPGTLFQWSDEDEHGVWSDVLSCFGTGRVDVRRADRRVLTVLLSDLDRSLAGKIITARQQSDRNPLDEALRSVSADVRGEAQARLAHGLNRYALALQTAMGADRRRWWVVATIGEERIDVVYRGRLQW